MTGGMRSSWAKIQPVHCKGLPNGLKSAGATGYGSPA